MKKKSLYTEAKECFVDTEDAKKFIGLDQSVYFLKKLKETVKKPLKMILLYGEPGIGKSILLNRLYLELSKTNSNVHIFLSPILDEHNFTKALYRKIFSKDEDIDFNKFVDLVNRELSFNSTLVLLDEAQLYSNSQMEKIRILSDTRKIKFVVSLHKTEQEDLIAKGHFQTRIWETIELKPPTINELETYIKKKLLGRNLFNIANQFNKKHIKFIYHYTKGNYRETNKFLYHLFEIYEYYEKNKPSKIDYSKISKKFLEMSAIKLGYIDV
ncbi:ATP-binding protein [Nitrosophilus labii]|uniref:ATP-binding protein n=1 Tax=Nitrosophilus labii TaxID=2706014 RepID=UPI0016574C2E|nr:ATP-binding protein [Nitrosophilus labii]